ncbi:MAG: hypothetical protein COA47_14885 [Robiginitomaculum sp.]|nr:MAG: hypothetical protein COA47_14885 [Robiginitomaculum sp.]
MRSCRPNDINNEEGFTLLEVLVAFVILAGSLGLIYSFLSNGMDRSELSSAEMTAMLIAQSKLAESETLPRNIEGDTGEFHWTVTRTPQQGSGQGARRQTLELDHVKVTVSWAGTKGKRHFDLESLRPVVQ